MHKLYFHPWRLDNTFVQGFVNMHGHQRAEEYHNYSIFLDSAEVGLQQGKIYKYLELNQYIFIFTHHYARKMLRKEQTKIPILDSEMKAEHHLNRVRHLAAKRITSVTRSCIYPITVGLL